MANTEDSFSSDLSALKSRYLLTHVGNQSFAFPSQWVAEIILVERSQVLSLPFYSPILLGVIHHQGLIVPIITAHLLLSKKINQNIQLAFPKEILSIIRLGQSAEHLSGVGIVVDRVIDQVIHQNINPDIDQAIDHSTTEPFNQSIIFQLADVPSQIWQPL